MFDVQIPDDIYRQASRAAQAHRVSLEEFVVGALRARLQDDPENYDHFFTPKIIAELDAAATEVRDGKRFTGEQADEHLAENRAKWLESHPS